MKNNINIIHVISYYPPHLGGMENCAEVLAERFAKEKFPVEVFTSSIGSKIESKNVKGVRINYLKSFEFAHTPIIFSLFSKLLSIPKNSIIHLHISQAFTPEIVYIISKIRKIPYIAHVHLDVDASGLFGFLLVPYKKYFLAKVLKNASKVVCLSDTQKKFIARKYKLPIAKIAVIPNGVDEKYFVKKILSENKTPQLLSIGRLASQKNIPYLINAISLLKKQIRLNIVGDGEDRKIIERTIRERKLGKSVTLVGRKTGNELISFYKKSDIFVTTSLKEGFSLAMLEAMAAGLPIIGIDSESTRALIENCGVVVKDTSPKAFAEAIDSLLSDKNKIKKLSDCAREKAHLYSWEAAALKFRKIYKEVSYVN